ncbi:MAG: hypothetical protein WBA23_06400 [Tunicatimonas sp.]|uniref:hypothetical protein n=1 Tax=Tunicatimonas sp. TaxID=1940096 RepID=UPI003C717B4F
MKRLSKNATIVFKYLYKNADDYFTISDTYDKLGLLKGDEEEVEKELGSLGLIQVENKSKNWRISEYGKRVYES